MRLGVKVVVVGEPTTQQLGRIRAFHQRWWNRVEVTTRGAAPTSYKGPVWWLNVPPRTLIDQSYVLDPDGCVWVYRQSRGRWFCEMWPTPISDELHGAIIDRTALFNGENPDDLRAKVLLAQLHRDIERLAAHW